MEKIISAIRRTTTVITTSVLKFNENANHYDGVIDCFTNGMCYWWAQTLQFRFASHEPKIVYDQIANHFGCKIGDEVFDITGVVTDKYNWEDFFELKEKDELLYNRLLRDCIYKEETECC